MAGRLLHHGNALLLLLLLLYCPPPLLLLLQSLRLELPVTAAVQPPQAPTTTKGGVTVADTVSLCIEIEKK